MRKVRPVSFNLKDTEERKLNDFVSKRTFSSYIKRLIMLDMEKELNRGTSQISKEEFNRIDAIDVEIGKRNNEEKIVAVTSSLY